MRPLLRSSLCALVLCFILFSNSFCGIALAESSTTTEQFYSVQPFSIPTNYHLYANSYIRDDNSFINARTVEFLDNNSSIIHSGSSFTLDSPDNLYFGLHLDFGSSILPNFYNSAQINLNSLIMRLLPTGIGFGESWLTLSPNAVPSNAYVTITGRYDFQIYDGDVGYTRWVYDNSFSIKKPLSVVLSDFGQRYFLDNEVYNPDQLAGFDMSLSYEFVNESDILNIPEYANRIYGYNEYSEGSQTSYVTGSMRFGVDDVDLYIDFNINHDNFVSYLTGEFTPFLIGSQYDFYTYLHLSPFNNSLTSVDIDFSEYEYENNNSILANISSSFVALSRSIGSNLSNVVENATDNANRIIQNTTNKINEVKEGVTEVKDSVVETKNSILDLPNKIKEMLIGLVVPDDETINAKYAEFDELLASRFGLIYQSADIIHDFAESFQAQAVMTADTGGIITMPSVTVNLVGTPFTFGGYDVDIIPDGFEFLQQALRLAISMVCTVVFVNMCKSKLEAILK